MQVRQRARPGRPESVRCRPYQCGRGRRGKDPKADVPRGRGLRRVGGQRGGYGHVTMNANIGDGFNYNMLIIGLSTVSMISSLYHRWWLSYLTWQAQCFDIMDTLCCGAHLCSILIITTDEKKSAGLGSDRAQGGPGSRDQSERGGSHEGSFFITIVVCKYS